MKTSYTWSELQRLSYPEIKKINTQFRDALYEQEKERNMIISQTLSMQEALKIEQES